MRKFEIGKKYRTGSYVFEVLKRTNKTVRVIQIQHEGRSKEIQLKIKKKEGTYYGK